MITVFVIECQLKNRRTYIDNEEKCDRLVEISDILRHQVGEDECHPFTSLRNFNREIVVFI